MDILYVVGTLPKKSSIWRNNELRFSLRSVEQFFPDHGTIHIAGKILQPITHVNFINAEDKFADTFFSDAQKNTNLKIRKAIESPDLSEEFVLFNDDFFLLKPFLDETHDYLGHMLDVEKLHQERRSLFYDAWRRTRILTTKLGVKRPLNFELHAPMVLTKTGMQEVFKHLPENSPYFIRSLHGNLFKRKPIKKVIDNKLSWAWKPTPEQLAKPCISIGNKVSRTPKFLDWVTHAYPTPSRYEQNWPEDFR